jgi:hypothetical protein
MYGEEEKAFQRLQEEIIKHTSDVSILAWKSPPTHNPYGTDENLHCGVLAETPAHFSWCSNTQLRIRPFEDGIPVENNRMKIESRIIVCNKKGDRQAWTYVLPIHYYQGLQKGIGSLGIQLRKVGADQYFRSNPFGLFDTTGALYSDCYGTHQLLFKTSTAPWIRSFATITPSWISDTHLWALRPSTIRFTFGPNVHRLHCIPTQRYDDEDDLFFVTNSYDHHDWGIVQLRVMFPMIKEKQAPLASADYTLCTASWGPNSRPQCSILPRKPFESQLQDIQSQMISRNGNTDKFLQLLTSKSIPRAEQNNNSILGVNSVAVLSFTCTERKDTPFKSRGFFHWDVHITCSFYKRGKAPQVPEAKQWVRRQK